MDTNERVAAQVAREDRTRGEAADAGPYLIWSHKHRGWWRDSARGYTPRLSEAGRFHRETAIQVCARSMPGAFDLGALPSLPVREVDINAMCDRYGRGAPGVSREPWE
jgi:hypothetical protein